jgi:group I intron endonuclease
MTGKKGMKHGVRRAYRRTDAISREAWRVQGSTTLSIHEPLRPAQKRGWLYKLVNSVNGKAYVGQTVKEQLSKRMDGHRTAHRRPEAGCRALNAAIKKYGWDAFRLEVLGRVAISELDAEEARLIKEHGTLAPSGYNILDGPSTSPFSDPRVREKRAETMKDPDVRKRLSDSVTAARKDRPDWIESTTRARRERAERERAVKMQGMSDHEKEVFLKKLEKARRSMKARRERTSSKFRPSVICSGEGASEDRSWMIPSDPED